MTNDQRSIALCRREGLSHAGARSARLAALLYRQNIRWGYYRALGRDTAGRLPRVKRLAAAYVAALAEDRRHPI